MSHFAVLGSKVFPEPPITSLTFEGSKSGGWFTSFPLAYLSAEDFSGLGIGAVYYSINKGVDWEIYTNPFYVEREGVSTIFYRAEDLAGNLEITNTQVVKIDTQGKWKDKTVISDNVFEVLTN